MKIVKIDIFNQELLVIEFNDNAGILSPLDEGDWKAIGKYDEIITNEKLLKELVHKSTMFESFKSNKYRYRSHISGFIGFKNPIDSFDSGLKERIFWENPKPFPSAYDPRSKTGRFEHGPELEKAEKEYKEFEKITFNKNKAIFYVKQR